MRTLFLKERAKRFIAASVEFAAFFGICFLHRVYAKDVDTETVRVGYYENEVFQEGAGEVTGLISELLPVMLTELDA